MRQLRRLLSTIFIILGAITVIPVTFVVTCGDGVTTIDPPEGLFDL